MEVEKMELIDDINVCIDENYTEIDKLDLFKKINSYIKYLRKRKIEEAEETI